MAWAMNTAFDAEILYDILEKKFWLTFAFVEMFGLVSIVAWALLYFT